MEKHEFWNYMKIEFHFFMFEPNNYEQIKYTFVALFPYFWNKIKDRNHRFFLWGLNAEKA